MRRPHINLEKKETIEKYVSDKGTRLTKQNQNQLNQEEIKKIDGDEKFKNEDGTIIWETTKQ